MRRLFLAIPVVPAGEMAALEEDAKQLLGNFDIRWASADGLHLTLAFIGEVDDALLAPIGETVRSALPAARPFYLQLRSLGFFGGSRPKVLWVGEPAEISPVTDLALTIQDALEHYHIPFDRKDFVPHITLGRVKGGVSSLELTNSIQSLNRLLPLTLHVKEVILYESLLASGKNPIYIPVETFSLG